ncbi:hypothetical protein FPANT_9822 [Fusarium pseudoanthophilum]|uniref:Kelch repeat-containing protein n=1 Tax=Fusarium pseudoanthophilum TaxID=48495 RepID=A0A8H5KUT1_9HYPO|nr:hypothetical protein FPANT_9822 [Fusarium pseudoanthophilum]
MAARSTLMAPANPRESLQYVSPEVCRQAFLVTDRTPDTWLAYQDLNNLVERSGDLWPDLKTSLSKNDSIPRVHGGIFWGDSVNQRFYLYGGEWNNGFSQEPYSLLSYDIIYDKWLRNARYNHSTEDCLVRRWCRCFGDWHGLLPRRMDKPRLDERMDRRQNDELQLLHVSGKFTQAASLSKQPKAEGGMVWIPAGDSLGLLVYLGGSVDHYGNNTEAPQPLDEVFVFDAKGSSWSTQKTTGEILQNRGQFCVDVAWAPDKSSFNVLTSSKIPLRRTERSATRRQRHIIQRHLHPDPPLVHLRGSLPRPSRKRHAPIRLFVIGGTYTDTDTDACDLAAGNNETYWPIYNPKITENFVPVDVYNVTGGNKKGGAKLVAPKDGFDEGNKPLQELLGRRPEIVERSPTRSIPSATGTSTASPKPSRTNSPVSKLPTGAIVGIAIGGGAGLAIILLTWFCVGKKVNRRREERRRSSMTENQYQVNTGNLIHPPSTVSPLTSTAYWGHAPEPVSPHHMSPHQSISISQVPPTELPAEQQENGYGVNELPQYEVCRKTPVSPGVSSPSWSPGPHSSYTPGRDTTSDGLRGSFAR